MLSDLSVTSAPGQACVLTVSARPFCICHAVVVGNGAPPRRLCSISAQRMSDQSWGPTCCCQGAQVTLSSCWRAES